MRARGEQLALALEGRYLPRGREQAAERGRRDRPMRTRRTMQIFHGAAELHGRLSARRGNPLALSRLVTF